MSDKRDMNLRNTVNEILKNSIDNYNNRLIHIKSNNR